VFGLDAHDGGGDLGEVFELLGGVLADVVGVCGRAKAGPGGEGGELLDGVEVGADKGILEGIEEAGEGGEGVKGTGGEVEGLVGVLGGVGDAEEAAEEVRVGDLFGEGGADVGDVAEVAGTGYICGGAAGPGELGVLDDVAKAGGV